MIKEEFCKSLLYKIKPVGPVFKFYPHKATLNYYTGCMHDCKYCYARYTMKNVGWDPCQFGENICVKANMSEVLKKELSKKTWNQSYKGIIHLGTVQDPFQPIEKKYGMTNEVLENFNEREIPTTILTKSNNVLDSLPIIKKMAKKDLIHIDFSIAFINETLRAKLEPGAPSFKERFNALNILNENGVTTGIFINPLIPYYTECGLEEIISRASDCKVKYIMLGFIHLNRGGYREVKEIISEVSPFIDFDSYFNFDGRRIVMKEEECYKVSKKCYDLSRKYNIPFITTKYHQFCTGSYNFGVYKHRYPLAYDYIEMMKKNADKKMNFDDAIDLAKGFNHDKSYLTSLKWYWDNEKLFSDFDYLKIETFDEGGEKSYVLHSL